MRENHQWYRIFRVFWHMTIGQAVMILWWSIVLVVVGIVYGFALGVIPAFIAMCFSGGQRAVAALALSLLVGCVVANANINAKLKRVPYKFVVFTIVVGYGLTHLWLTLSWLCVLLGSFGFVTGHALRFYQIKQKPASDQKSCEQDSAKSV